MFYLDDWVGTFCASRFARRSRRKRFSHPWRVLSTRGGGIWGNSLGTCYHGDIMGISWGYHGDIMGISWGIMELVETFFKMFLLFLLVGNLDRACLGMVFRSMKADFCWNFGTFQNLKVAFLPQPSTTS